MERNRWADDFIDCVVRRSEFDIAIRTRLVITMMVLPFILSLCAAVYIEMYKTQVFEQGSEYMGGWVIIIAECTVVCFIFHSLCRSTHSHSKRDLRWMDSLIGYVESYGSDASHLRVIREKASRETGRAGAWISFAIFMFNFLFLIAAGIYLFNNPGADLLNYMVVLSIVPYALVLVQMLLAVGGTFGFPSRHDSLQSEFTREFSRRSQEFGLNVKPMECTVKKPSTLIALLLFVLTFGLYTLIMIVITCKGIRKHLKNQWEYESQLMVSIIRFEGGIGIEEGVGHTDESPLSRMMHRLS